MNILEELIEHLKEFFIFIQDKIKDRQVYIPLIIIASLFILGPIIFNMIDNIKMKKAIENHLSTINEDNNISENFKIGSLNYKFTYNSDNETSSLYIIDKEFSNEFHYYKNEWYTKIPEYFNNENTNYQYIKINKDDLAKSINIESDSMEDYLNWMKNFNKSIVTALIIEAGYRNVEMTEDNLYSVTWEPKKREKFDKIIEKSLKNIELNDKDKIKDELVNQISKWKKDNTINYIKVDLRKEGFVIIINYTNSKDVKNELVYQFETNITDNEILINENNVLDISNIKDEEESEPSEEVTEEETQE